MSTKEQPAFEVRLRSRRVQRELDSLQEAGYQRVATRLRALVNDPRRKANSCYHGNVINIPKLASLNKAQQHDMLTL